MGSYDKHHWTGADFVLDQSSRIPLQHWDSGLAELSDFLRHASLDGILHNFRPDHLDCIYQRHFLLPRASPEDWPLGAAIHSVAFLGPHDRELCRWWHTQLAKRVLGRHRCMCPPADLHDCLLRRDLVQQGHSIWPTTASRKRLPVQAV